MADKKTETVEQAQPAQLPMLTIKIDGQPYQVSPQATGNTVHALVAGDLALTHGDRPRPVMLKQGDTYIERNDTLLNLKDGAELQSNRVAAAPPQPAKPTPTAVAPVPVVIVPAQDVKPGDLKSSPSLQTGALPVGSLKTEPAKDAKK